MATMWSKFWVTMTAMDLYRSQGMDFTLSDIAAEHDATIHEVRGMIGSKKQLFEDMLEHNGDLLLSHVQAVVEKDGPVPERIHGLLHGLVEYHSELVAFPARSGREGELRRACRGLLRGLAAKGVVDGSLDCADPDEAADVALDATEHFHTWGVSGVTRHMIELGVDPKVHAADPWPATLANEMAFDRRWIALRRVLGIRNATSRETRVVRDHARQLLELRQPVAA